MKNIISLLILLCSISLSAQSPQGFKYQGLARDGSGTLLADQAIALRISILENTNADCTGTIVYQERQTVTTNDNGLFWLNVGEPTETLSGDFSTIDWGANAHCLQVEMDPAGGTDYLNLGTSSLLSVPYALYAENAGSDEDWIIQGGTMYNENAGNVGIGTNAPQEKLDVDGNINATGALRATRMFDQDDPGFNIDPAGQSILNAVDADFFRDKDDRNFFMDPAGATQINSLTTSGNAGLGIAVPSERLDVAGNIKATGTVIAARFTDINDGSFTLHPSGQSILNAVDADFFRDTEDRNFFVNPAGISQLQTLNTSGNVNATGIVHGARFTDINDGSFTLHPSGQSILNAVDADFFRDTEDRNFFVNPAGQSVVNSILTTGNVGIGTNTPSEKLEVVGNICASGSIASCSDERYKTNFQPLENVLAKIGQLNGLYYDWKTEDFPEKGFTDQKQIGVIAQEVELYFPEIVVTNAEGYKSVDYAKLAPVLLEAIKEQQALIGQLQDSNTELRAELTDIGKQFDERVNRIEALLTMAAKSPAEQQARD